MAFPSTTPSIESEFVPAQGIASATSLAGATVTRDRYKGRMTGTFNLVYRGLTEAEKDAFFTDYDLEADSWSYTWPMDSSTHTVIYAGTPVAQHRAGALLWDVNVALAKIPAFAEDLTDQSGDAIEDQGATPIENQAS